jgi:hypothetical protein
MLSLLTKTSLDEHDAMAGSDNVATHLLLFPNLIAAANVILAGMLSTSDGIGTASLSQFNS